jgi:hypothetical protein
METSFQGIDVPPYWQELYASKCVHHVSEQVFRMSPVYTEGGLAPAASPNSSLVLSEYLKSVATGLHKKQSAVVETISFRP